MPAFAGMTIVCFVPFQSNSAAVEESRPFVTFARVPSPGFCHSHTDHSAKDIFQDVEGRRITTAGRDSIFEWWSAVHEIIDGELNADVFQIVVRRVLASVITEREIDGVIRGQYVVVIVDRAAEGPVADGAARRQALEGAIR